MSKEKSVDKAAWASLRECFGLGEPVVSHEGEAVCEKPHFELFIVVVVMINALLMALELDFSKKNDTLEQRLGWVITDVSFCVFFAGEIGFRIWCLGAYEFFKQPRYLCDFFLVVMNIGDTSMQLSGSESESMESLSALRILRLVKMTKLFRLVSHVKELNLIATGLVSALRSLQWVSLLLGVVIFVMAVMFKMLLGRECDDQEIMVAFSYRFADIDPTVKCEEFWGSVIRSMYTLYQITTMESWSEVLVRPILDSRPMYVFIILVFQLVTTFGLLNIVVAAIVDGTMNSIDEAVVENQAKKRTSAHLKVLRDIFVEATPGDTADVTKELLLQMLTRPEIRRKLMILDIEYDDPAQIWRIVDSDGTGSVGIEEFTINLMRMRGTAKAKDLLAIRSQIYRVSKDLENKVDIVTDLCRSSMSSPGDLALPAAPKSVQISEAVPDSSVISALERFQTELRGELGQISKATQQLSEQFQAQLGSFGEKLSRDVNQRLAMFEMQQKPPASKLAPQNSLLVVPSSIPIEPSIPFLKPCCAVTVGENDRAALVKDLGVPVFPPPSRPPEPLSPPLLQASSIWKGDASNPKTELISLLEKEHGLLLSRLNQDIPKATQEAIYTDIYKAPEPKLPEPKASDFPPQTPPEMPVPEVLAIPNTTIYSVANMEADTSGEIAGSLLEDAEALQTIEKATKNLAGFEKDLEDKKKLAASQESKAEKFVHGPHFEAFFAFLITMNAGIMALEVQYTGMDTGFELKYPGMTTTAKDNWPGAHEAFAVLEMMFGVVFVLELIIKIVVLRLKFVKCAWNMLDTVIVGGWLLDSAVGVSAVLNPMMLRLFRLVKLLRVAKLFKSFQAFDSLSILIGSLRASASVLFWSLVILFTAQLAAALFLSQGLGDYFTSADSDVIGSDAHKTKIACFELFGTFSRSWLTTMQLTFGNWVPVCRILHENVSSAWSSFIMFYVIFINFAAIKVISAVFLLETQKVAATDEELLILQKERQITRLIKNFAGVFQQIDKGHDGAVDWEEFQAVIRDHRVLTWLAALDLDIEQCGGMFEMLSGSDGKMSFQEFVKGVQRLKGDAKAIDQVLLMNRVAELTQIVVNIQGTLANIERSPSRRF